MKSEESEVLTFETLIEKYKSKFLNSVATLDIDLTLILSDYFVRRDDDFSLWLDSIFDEDKWATFGQKIVWLGKILKHRFTEYEKRKELINVLEEIRILRNQFAHQFSLKPTKEESDRAEFKLYDLKDGKLVPIVIKGDFITEMSKKINFVKEEFEKIRPLVLIDRKKNSNISGKSFESRL